MKHPVPLLLASAMLLSSGTAALADATMDVPTLLALAKKYDGQTVTVTGRLTKLSAGAMLRDDKKGSQSLSSIVIDLDNLPEAQQVAIAKKCSNLSAVCRASVTGGVRFDGVGTTTITAETVADLK